MKSYNDKNDDEFVFDVKEIIMNNLVKYKNVVDVMNFKEVYDDVGYF